VDCPFKSLLQNWWTHEAACAVRDWTGGLS
jgi:hypothetical protein